MTMNKSIFLPVFKITAILFVISALAFAVMGDWLESIFDAENCVRIFRENKIMGGFLAVGLFIADLFLPLPATGIMAALGKVYGVVMGTVLTTLGILATGIIGYLISRFFGKKFPNLLGDVEQAKAMQRVFEKHGPALIILSRFTPILPEIVIILAGLNWLSWRRFIIPLTLSGIFVGLCFSLLGQIIESIWLGMILASVIPLFLWQMIKHFLRET